MNLSRLSFDPLPPMIALIAGLLTAWLVADRPTSIDVFQSPPPVLSYAKTVDKTQVRVNDSLTYNIIITNTGGPTTDTLVVDQLAPEMRWLNVVTATYGASGYDPSFRRIGWFGALNPNATLVISWSVVITAVPPHPGQVLTNSFIAVSDSTAVATRFVKTIVFTGTPPFTTTPLPTETPTTTPSPTATPTQTPAPTRTATPRPTYTPPAVVTPTPTAPDKPAATLKPLLEPAQSPTPATPKPASTLDWPAFLPETGR